MTQPRKDTQPAGGSGSKILTAWRAEREAMRAQGEVPVSGITKGTEAYTWLTGYAGPGRAISERSAMSLGAVYACVSLIGGAIASLTLETYQRDGDSRLKYRPNLWWLLNEQMHTMWSAPVAWEFMTQGLLLHGDLFGRIHRAGRYSPDVESIEPLHPLSVDPRKVNNRLVYVVYTDDGVEVVDQDDMIHVPGPGFDGRRGMSQIRHTLRQPASIAMAAGEQSEAMLNDGLRPDLVLKSGDAKLTEPQIDKLRSMWMERYGGAKNSSAPIVLSGGMDIKEISISPQDAQLLETTKMTVEDVARVFGVPPWMIGQTEKTTSWGSGVEQMGIGFVKYTLQRHLVKIEQEINRKLFKTARNFVEFNTATLERGDFKSRNEGYRIGLGRAGEPAWLMVNEVRRMENLPPVPGGDTLNKGDGNAPEQDPPAAE